MVRRHACSIRICNLCVLMFDICALHRARTEDKRDVSASHCLMYSRRDTIIIETLSSSIRLNSLVSATSTSQQVLHNK